MIGRDELKFKGAFRSDSGKVVSDHCEMAYTRNRFISIAVPRRHHFENAPYRKPFSFHSQGLQAPNWKICLALPD